MTALTFLEGIGHADHCQISVTHRPKTLRYIWHHRLPQVCGGQTIATNLVSLCDSCHMSVHIIMWRLANNQGAPLRCNVTQYKLAWDGWQEAVTAGTANLIPKEA